MSPRPQRVRRLQVGSPLPHQAPECRLDMAGRTAEPVIEFHMPECGVEIVLDEEVDRQPADPDALRITCRSREQLRGLGQLVGLLRRFPLAPLLALAPTLGL